jgi:heme-degrading monooxygenase HmoA
MIARIGIFHHVTPEAAAALHHNLVARFRPALKAQAGFIARYWLTDAGGKHLSVTIWEDEAALRTGGARANAVPLLPGQDPERIPSPDLVALYDVVTCVPPLATGDEPDWFARVATYEGTPVQVDQTVRNLRERGIPALAQLPGFRGGYWLVDRAAGKGMNLTLWASEAAVHASAAATERLREEGVRASGVRPTSVETFQVQEWA